MKKGLFIAFEGIDGSGKSTQVKLLNEKFKDLNLPSFTTCEPTNNEIGKMIRAIFTGKAQADPRTVAGLFVADRLDHLLNKEDGMRVLLDRGVNVITDRYYFSSYAYHSVFMDMDWVINANAMARSIAQPDLTIFIDIAPQTSMLRINEGRNSTELYENLENLTKVRALYLQAIERFKDTENIVVFDGNMPVQELHGAIWQKVKTLIK